MPHDPNNGYHTVPRTNKWTKNVLPLLCFICICPSVFASISRALHWHLARNVCCLVSRFSSVSACKCLCIIVCSFQFSLFLQVSRNMAIKNWVKDTPKIAEQQSLYCALQSDFVSNGMYAQHSRLWVSVILRSASYCYQYGSIKILSIVTLAFGSEVRIFVCNLYRGILYFPTLRHWDSSQQDGGLWTLLFMRLCLEMNLLLISSQRTINVV